MSYSWVGSRYMFLDEISVSEQKGIHIGRYGGHTLSGANKNEDGLMIIQSETGHWKLAVLMDAHQSADSATLIIDYLLSQQEELDRVLNSSDTFQRLDHYFSGLFTGREFRDACQHVEGETACLILYQRDQYLWWFSVGDCAAYLLHPQLAEWDQYMLNQRQFYEWIGRVNTFDQPVPCYSSGRRELRSGRNVIVMLTDGVLDGAEGYYNSPAHLYEALYNDNSMSHNLHHILNRLHTHQAYDSATLICWEVDNPHGAAIPSDMK